MQRIIIGKNFFLGCYEEEWVKFLIEILGNDYNYWRNYEIDNCNNDLKKLRQNVKLIEEIEKRNGIIGCNQWDDIECKIITIPDEVKWGVGIYDCSGGEYIYEKHRTWD